ncbi:1-acyl-sn-glycerol-3-phosphate acyltransferases [Nakamurella panacisegetis]|uniref:1-acyl-sn-glycerol-3-phosphate acyltransferases n=1 Tax=Nakamurella panacisegetis TaxID=1090615 RepID=A0A1H0KT01_9ACTN|nr:lysophospholipid acyltransferase family protein [Nakamurella panacisegetis]SDO58913.1 1-acyl-sn-glycerol-3-phosphate acyltransferases [Nakamurella panacisegetis]
MRDRVYRVVARIARGVFGLLDIRFDIRGAHHLPAAGPAVIASNHISYLDFAFVGLVAQQRRRMVRFLAKGSVFRRPLIGPLMRAMGHIPVSRASGAGAYRHAERALQSDQFVGVFPEATISRSWTLKPFKVGAAALATDQRVPLVPIVTWGGHRILTVDGRYHLRRHLPVTILVGEPILPDPARTATEANALLGHRMAGLLDLIQRDYPERPADLRDRWWLPRHLGGSAPDPVSAAAIDAARIRP